MTNTTLAPRQAEVLGLMADGLTAKECAQRLGISHRTIEVHVALAIAKLFAKNRVHAIVMWDRANRVAA